MFRKIIICTFLIVTSLVYGYSEQVVVSQFDIGLKNSDNYILNGLEAEGTIKAITNKNDSLGDTLSFDYTYGSDFSKVPLTDNYSYPSEGAKGIIIPVKRNADADIKEGSFQLRETLRNTVTNEDVTTILLEENYVLPAKAITLAEVSVNSGNRFVYSESTSVKTKHLEKYKIQEFMIRISRKSENSDFDVVSKLNGIKLAINTEVGHTKDNAQEFYEGKNTYTDFWVTGDKYDKEQKIETNSGMGLRFIPGKIDLFGLPKGEYRVEVYSFRYSRDISNKGNLVITKESSLDFKSENYLQEEGLNLISFYTGNYPSIEATLLTVSKTMNPLLNINESSNGFNKVPDGIVITRLPMNKVFFDETTPIDLDADGYDTKTKLYYQKWKITYTTLFRDMDNYLRTVSFIMPNINKTIKTEYGVKVDVPIIEGYPHQIVMATFNPSKTWSVGDYEVLDRNMSKYSRGYKEIKVTEVVNMEKLFRGDFIDSFTMILDTVSFNWANTGNKTNNSLVMKKVPSESKGVLTKVGGATDLTYYTTLGISGFKYQEEGLKDDKGNLIPPADKATFTWESPKKSSFGVTLNEDKLIFRIVKLAAGEEPTTQEHYSIGGNNYVENLPKKYYKHYEKTNVIQDSETDIDNFVKGYGDYFDLVFDSGEDKELTLSNAVFTFSKDNSLQIVGLPRGSYMVQVYSIQDEDSFAKTDDSYDYRVLTYNGYKKFEMGLPTLVTGDFLKQNNIFLIDRINLDATFDEVTNAPTKKIQLGFFTKAQTTLPTLTVNNLVARRDEAVDKKERAYAVTEQRNNTGNILPVSDLTIGKSTKEDFQFPLDIVLAIDNSGSMGDEITAVKNGLSNFTKDLEARGFNVKYNLITFGPVQNSKTKGDTSVALYDDYRSSDTKKINPYLAMYKANKTWFSDVEEIKTALDKLKADSGYWAGQENGAWAIKRGMDFLKSSDRFLNKENKIVTGSGDGFIPSQKWVIFLTDENLNVNGQRALYNATSDSEFKTKFLEDVKNIADEYKIILTGIYKVNDTNPAKNQVDDIGKTGTNPADTNQMNYNEIKTKLGTDLFKRYEMGSSGGNVSTALAHAVNNVGIIQRWEMSYTSPFVESDGLEREVIFSLKGLPKVKQYDTATKSMVEKELVVKPIVRSNERKYIVPQQKLEANFINPDPAIKKLIKRDGKIILKAMARSEYRAANGVMYNYPIKKGIFIITNENGKKISVSSDDIGVEKVTLRDFVNGSGQKWYEATSLLDGPKFEEFFGKTPILSIQFTAETAEEAKTIQLQGVDYAEGDLPKVTQFKMTNTTLQSFMESLKTTDNSPLFIDTTAGDGNVTGPIKNATVREKKNSDGLGILEVGASSVGGTTTKGMDLNTKAGDRITLEFTVSDESISLVDGVQRGIVQVIYNGVPYNAVYVGTGAGLNETKWKIENLPYSQNNTTIRFNITDGTSLQNQSLLNKANEVSDTNKYLKVFTEPALLDNTEFRPNLNPNADSSGKYFNSALTTVMTKTDDILAYLAVFDYDMTKVDSGAPVSNYATQDTLNWVSSLNGEFNLGDGAYKYNNNGVIYVMNKAGAIKTITTSSVNTIPAIVTTIGTGTKEFYVDTVVPVVVSPSFEKIRDANHDEFLGNTLSLGILEGLNKPYKVGDTIRLGQRVTDVNYSRVVIPPGLANGSVIDTVNGASVPNPTIGVSNALISQQMIAADLTSGEGKNDDPILLEIYDKAGNLTSTSLGKIYDDRVPKAIESISKINTSQSGNIKFTNDLTIPLTEGSIPLSVGRLVSGTNTYFGYLPKYTGYTGTETNSLSNFTGFNPIENIQNRFDIVTYSQSGVRSNVVNDAIVLDSEINYSGTIYEVNSTYTNYKYQVDLNTALSKVTELVGLSEFTITSSDATNLTTTLVKSSSGRYPLTGAPYSVSKVAHGFTVNNKLQFSTSSKGNVDFVITVYDRLGNSRSFNYIVQIPNDITIIGKTSSSVKEVKSRVGVMDKVKISSRIEK